jgi:hypothetical protein
MMDQSRPIIHIYAGQARVVQAEPFALEARLQDILEQAPGDLMAGRRSGERAQTGSYRTRGKCAERGH